MSNRFAEPTTASERGITFGGPLTDGNCTGTCTPRNRPVHPGPGAPRHPGADLLQMAFYTEWLHKHGIKHLALDGPDGLVR
jgi:hypothetical protein